jgi:type IV pilus assembly protein PilM
MKDKMINQIEEGEGKQSWKSSLSGLFRNPFDMGSKATLGIDIGNKSIKMIVVRRRRKKIESVFGEIIKRPSPGTHEKNSIEDFIPLIKDSVKNFKDEINRVTISVQGPEVMIRRVAVPPMPKNELKSALPWMISKFLPYPIEEAIFDYKILGEKEENNELELILVVARKNWINKLISQMKKIGLPPSIVTVHPFALGNLVNFLNMEKGSFDVVVNISEKVTSICFFSPERLEFSRDIMTAGGAITAALTGKVTYKGKEFTIDPKKAEELKCRYGIPMNTTSEFSEMGIPFASINALIRPAVERLATEIDRSIKYAGRSYNIDNINKLYLVGGSANLINLPEYLSTAIDQRVEVFNPAEALIQTIEGSFEKKSRAIFKKYGSSLSVALGLALEGEAGINLISTKGVRDIRIASFERKLLQTAASLLFLVLAGTSLNLEIRKKIDEKKLAGMYTSWESIKEAPSFYEVQSMQEKVKGIQKLLGRLNDNREFTSLFLKDISHRKPEEYRRWIGAVIRNGK